MSDPLMLLHRDRGGEAAAGLPPAPEEPGFVEYEVLRTTLAALDAVPRQAPPPATLTAITDEAARAAVAAGPNAAVGALYTVSSTARLGAPEGETSAEDVLLRSTASALGVLPAASPSEGTLAAVMTRAREAAEASREARLVPVRYVYGEADAAAPGPQTAGATEVAWLEGARRVLEGAPKERPATATLEAILARAQRASRPSVALAVTAPTVDRAAARPSRARRRTSGVWAGAFAGVLALVAVVALFRTGPPADLAASSEASAVPAIASAQEASPVPEASGAEPAALAAAASSVAPADNVAPAPAPSPVPAAVAAGLAVASVTPAARQQAPAPQASAPRAAPEGTPGVQLASTLRPVEGPAEASSWEAAEDVRILSLRLQALREQNAGMGWNEPAEPFGAAPSAAPASFTPGVQAVGTAPAPVRAQVRARVSAPPR